MRFSASLLVLATPFFVSAAPVRRAAADISVFKFAQVLEQLESQFYTQALAKFQDADFQAAGFTSSQIPSQLFSGIQGDEAAHTSFLETAIRSLGDQPITGCNFDFASVLTDVSTMASAARIVENVGVGAYLGGATLLTDPRILDAAASILTVEARHQTVLNILNTGSAVPQSFDVPLTPSEVLAIAGPFISGCDTGISANPPLSITNTGTVAPGTLLTFASPAINSSTPTNSLFCQMMLGGQTTSIALPINNCVVPSNINGPVVIWITSDGQPLVNNVVDRATSQLVAGPTMAFIDTQVQMLGMLARTPSNSAAQSITTSTISPAQAQSIVQSATATSTSTTAAAAAATPEAPPPNNASAGEVDGGSVTVDGWTTVSSPPTV
jgi:hypothetical protein